MKAGFCLDLLELIVEDFSFISSITSKNSDFEVKLTRDSSLKKRYMSKLISVLSEFGTEIFPQNKFNLPDKETQGTLASLVAGWNKYFSIRTLLATTRSTARKVNTFD